MESHHCISRPQSWLLTVTRYHYLWDPEPSIHFQRRNYIALTLMHWAVTHEHMIKRTGGVGCPKLRVRGTIIYSAAVNINECSYHLHMATFVWDFVLENMDGAELCVLLSRHKAISNCTSSSSVCSSTHIRWTLPLKSRELRKKDSELHVFLHMNWQVKKKFLI